MRNLLLVAVLGSALGSPVLNLRPNELQRSSRSSSSFDDSQAAASRERSLEEETLHLRKKLKKSQQIEKQLQVELLLRTTERDLLKWRLNG